MKEVSGNIMRKGLIAAVIGVLLLLSLPWGRIAVDGAPTPEYFTIVVLPDTQWYSHVFPEIFRAQTQWITDNQDKEDIRFVIHVGDIVQDWDSERQWDNARGAMDSLGDIPYLVVGGNHDGSCNTGERCDWTYFRRYFGEPTSHALFSVGSRHFLVVGMEWYEPPYPDPLYQQVSDWFDLYPDREAIFVTHAFANTKGGWAQTPSGYSQWIAVRDAPNLSMILWGHFHGQYYDRWTGTEGNTVHRMLANYQSGPNGGNGWLRLLRFYPDGTVWVLTYSPWLEQYWVDEAVKGHLLETYPGLFMLWER